MRRTGLTTALTLVCALSTWLVADVKFMSTWKSIDAGSVRFTGKTVAALVISKDDSLRVSGEEALVRELNARGMKGVATYRIAPKEELQSAERAKPWFERATVEGVVALRPVSADKRSTYTPGFWSSPNYASFWGYYGNSWGSVYVPGSMDLDTVVVAECAIFSVSRNELMWGAVSETRNPKNLQQWIEELVKESVEQLQKQGLAGGVAK